MKKWLKILGVLVLLLVVAGIAFFYFVVQPALALDRESREFAQEAATKVAQGWDYNVLASYSAPELIQLLEKDKQTTEKLIETFKARLGNLIEIVAVKGEARIFITPGAKTITARYTIDTDFEKAKGAIRMNLMKKEKWSVSGFHVNSPALLP
jgi:hypothetical protein